MDKIFVFDTTLRDGEQSPGASMAVEQKVEVARLLAGMGVDIIEAGFPISSQVQFEGVKRIAENVDGPTIAGLARALEKDITTCYEAVKPAKKKRIHTSSGDLFSLCFMCISVDQRSFSDKTPNLIVSANCLV